MKSLQDIYDALRPRGFRMTRVRTAILQFLIDQHCALSVQDIVGLLAKQDLKPDASTLYRELQFLSEQGIAQEIIFKDGIMRYELKEGGHHHHLICNSCDTVEAVEMDKHLEDFERMIQGQKRFRVQSHSLEF
ncbi:MAG: transcriptional repressor [bacterium]|nr:transcriptional repressor [bacterium]